MVRLLEPESSVASLKMGDWQFVSVRSGLETDLAERIVELLSGLDSTEEGREILASLKKTTKFDAVPPEAASAIKELRRLMDLVSD